MEGVSEVDVEERGRATVMFFFFFLGETALPTAMCSSLSNGFHSTPPPYHGISATKEELDLHSYTDGIFIAMNEFPFCKFRLDGEYPLTPFYCHAETSLFCQQRAISKAHRNRYSAIMTVPWEES